MENKVAIICVCKSGGDFKLSDVERLRLGVESNTTVPYTFYCLTDIKGGKVRKCTMLLLKHDYKGWWSKIEMFRPNLVEEERIVYFDLDTVIIGNIDDFLLQDKDFIGLRPVNPIKAKLPNYAASGILGFRNGALDFVYKMFHYERQTKRYNGDQDYMSDILLFKHVKFIYWQDLVSGIYSYKRNIQGKEASTFIDARVICFHGYPRPTQISYEWLNRLEEERKTIHL